MSELHPHPDLQAQCHLIGQERQPVLVIDNLIASPEQLVKQAAQQSFNDNTGLFPGHRAMAPDSYKQLLESVLPGLLKQHFGTRPGDLQRIESNFSLVTQTPDTLKPLQRIPHFDSCQPSELASIFFLCNRERSEYGGTAFYRHNRTGYEWIDHERYDPYMQSLEDDAKDHGLPPADYIRRSTDLFEQIAQFPAVYNRLLLYRCTSLHSGVIGPDFNFDHNPRTARLSINSFLVG